MGLAAFTRPVPYSEKMCLSGFESGVEELDRWLVSYGHLARKRGTAVVYLSYQVGSNICEETPAGFYTLSSSAVDRRDVASGWLKRNTPEKIPVILLGMLAVDKRFQGQGLGVALLHDAAVRAGGISQSLGAKALVVDPLDDVSRGFYEKYGFTGIPGSSRMFAKLV